MADSDQLYKYINFFYRVISITATPRSVKDEKIEFFLLDFRGLTNMKNSTKKA